MVQLARVALFGGCGIADGSFSISDGSSPT